MLTLLLLTSLVAGVALGARHRRNWMLRISNLEKNCTGTVGAKTSNDRPIQVDTSWKSLPPIVRRYFKQVFSPIEFGQPSAPSAEDDGFDGPMIQVARFCQVGKFNQKNKWLTMSAAQSICTKPTRPGFVWRAEMCVVQGWRKRFLPKVHICDAWVHGEGHLLASLHGIVPLVTDGAFLKNKEELQKGEMMRFLAEAFLTPTALLPESGLVHWGTTDQENKALLTMNDTVNNIFCEVEVLFSNDTITVRGVRPKVEGRSFVNLPWGGTLSGFRFVEKMWIPTHMECGWVNKLTGDLDLYFVADNSEIVFEFAARGADSNGVKIP